MSASREYVKGEFDPNSPKGIVKNFMNALLGYTDTKVYDENGMDAFFTDDIELHLPGTRPDTPWAGSFHGKKELEEFWKICAEHLDIINHDVQHIIADGDKVVVIAHEKMASLVTGRYGEQIYAWLFQLRGGKIWYWRLFENTEVIANTFGKRG
jgi:ketosteroid isomerase-like protein